MTEFRYEVTFEGPDGEATVGFLSRRPAPAASLSGPTGDDLAYLRGRVREETPGPAHITAVAVTAA
ncbi:hypothetical protein [Melissospora conviva]|uniref:hypothetical protein n=1 Tax=Melissospora conviva TaxID=3388432 RepID=UPI003C22CBA9